MAFLCHSATFRLDDCRHAGLCELNFHNDLGPRYAAASQIVNYVTARGLFFWQEVGEIALAKNAVCNSVSKRRDSSFTDESGNENKTNCLQESKQPQLAKYCHYALFKCCSRCVEIRVGPYVLCVGKHGLFIRDLATGPALRGRQSDNFGRFNA